MFVNKLNQVYKPERILYYIEPEEDVIDNARSELLPDAVKQYAGAFGTYDKPGIFFIRELGHEVFGIEFRKKLSVIPEYAEGAGYMASCRKPGYIYPVRIYLPFPGVFTQKSNSGGDILQRSGCSRIFTYSVVKHSRMKSGGKIPESYGLSFPL